MIRSENSTEAEQFLYTLSFARPKKPAVQARKNRKSRAKGREPETVI